VDYVPPYTPRAGHQHRRYAPLSGKHEDLAVTLHAGITRQPRDGSLPVQVPHVELHLAWKEKGLPDWNVRVVGGWQNGRQMGMIRWMVKGVIEQLPVVWRLSAWL
jgi:hypothetical protein